MFAVVEIGGKQFTVTEQEKVKTPLLKSKVGDKVTFDRVLLVKSDKDTVVGTPTVGKAKVKATVLEHGRDKKVRVFKKKRRNDYKVNNGHRQDFTLVQIESISGVGKPAAPKKAKKEEPAPKPKETKKPKADEPKAEEPVEVKKETAAEPVQEEAVTEAPEEKAEDKKPEEAAEEPKKEEE